jgi:hypothetical protein
MMRSILCSSSRWWCGSAPAAMPPARPWNCLAGRFGQGHRAGDGQVSRNRWRHLATLARRTRSPCSAPGRAGRWIDGKNWSYDFDETLPAGRVLHLHFEAELRTLAGAAVTGRGPSRSIPWALGPRIGSLGGQQRGGGGADVPLPARRTGHGGMMMKNVSCSIEVSANGSAYG